ncbi:TlpA family protein disulfide reductase [Bradyrhizobium sp. 200]|uniref:TlpA disulfide reductase family protein n=1 Tax=Bradyrhizobium sp. 200 TaxID=2782665 RepID=UPI001FFE3C73|nr:TlpA disulfide reductase family protein [Bradyrhizobium sp. 200]UPJ47772.1 TlpA family protein disulfide reductase [Bradyrhizobium sp. 200]
MVLRMESLSPPINVDSRGPPLMSFQPGSVYVVEFWATWCMPFIAAMFHLVQLQEKYKDGGLQVLGVAAHERARTADDTRTKLTAWLTKNLPNLNYRIAFDYTGEMNKLRLDRSCSCESPTSLVIDRDGYIASMDDAMQLDDVLSKVLDRIWRASDGS